jgi:acetylornithine/N-succinyldiaminopimelate aminotransferase
MNPFLVKTYKRYPLEVQRAEGVYLFNQNNEAFLDLTSGISVSSLGHSNKKLINVAKKQLDHYWHLSNLFESEHEKELSEKLAARSELDYVFYTNSGTEANEAAIKFTRLYQTGKKKILHLSGSFHGRTFGSMAVTDKSKIKAEYLPEAFETDSFSPNDIEELLLKADKDTAAIIIEVIQGENGIRPVSNNSMREIRRIADELDILLIVDEIQTGFGRTGKFFAYQWSGIKPDIVTAAKSIANGLPLGATILSKKVAEKINYGDHGSTFGGNPVALAVANSVVDMIDSELLKRINELSDYFFIKLSELDSLKIKEIRGKGLMIGIELHKGSMANDVIGDLLKKRIICLSAGDHVLRLLPAYCISKDEIDHFVNELKNILT